MRKILVVTRPVDNAGDWLITERLVELTRQVVEGAFGEADVEFCPATREMPVGLYNSFDAVVAGGGPIADDRLLSPSAFHLMSVLEDVEVPVSLIGIGWYGRTPKAADVYGAPLFSGKVRSKLSQIARGGGDHQQGVRHAGGHEAQRRRLGHDRLPRVVRGRLRAGAPQEAGLWRAAPHSGLERGITKDPELHGPVAEQTIALLELLGSRFPRSELLFTFNGGIDTRYSGPCNREIARWLDDHGVEYEDISGDAGSFALYEGCDMHVGYRLHTHLYCVSRGIPSILIEEDARGADANLTLGTPGPRAYDQDDPSSRNPWLVEEVGSALDWYLESGFAPMEAALHAVSLYAPAMREALMRAVGA